MHRTLLALTGTAILGSLQSCCVKTLTLKPEAELIAGKITASSDIAFEFEECLTETEKEQADRIKRLVGDEFEALLQDMSPEHLKRYNEINELAQSTLRKVVYAKSAEGPGYGAGAPDQTGSLKAAADDIAERLARGID